jgi:hypothetical protein
MIHETQAELELIYVKNNLSIITNMRIVKYSTITHTWRDIRIHRVDHIKDTGIHRVDHMEGYKNP